MGQGKAIAGAVAAALILAAGAAAAEERPYPTSCEPDGVPLVAESKTATLFIQRTQGTPSTTLFGCRRADTRISELGLRDPDEAYFAPPAISLAGSRAGWALDTYDRDGDRVTYVIVADLAQPADERVVKAGTRYPKVGSLRVHPDGGVAWITCPSDDDSPRGSQRPNCTKAGALDRVYALDAGATKPRLLDRSRAIDPRSLRRKGDRISWVRAGKRRSAKLH